MSGGLGPTPLTRAQRRLVADQMGFVQKAVRYYAYRFRKTLGADDVRQIIQLALTEAARSFDPTHGISFPSFVWRSVSGALFDAAREESSERALVRRAVGAAAALEQPGVDLEADAAADQARADAATARFATAGAMAFTAAARSSAGVEPAPPTRTPEDELLAAELRATLTAALAKLPERSRRVVSLYYGEERTLREVSAELEVSYATVRRDHEEALDLLREGCTRAGVEPMT